MSLASKVGKVSHWRLVLGLMIMWAWLPVTRAEEQQLETAVKKPSEKTEGKKKGDGQAKEKKPAPELEKARAQVKELAGQMKKLHEQMRDTGEKLRKAMGEVARLSGPKDNKWGAWWGKEAEKKKEFGHFHGKGPWGHHGWAKDHGWHRPWGGPPPWHRFGHGHWGPPGRDGWRGPSAWGPPHAGGWRGPSAWGPPRAGTWPDSSARRGTPSSSADLERRLDRLQRELEELRRELRRK